VHACSTTFLVVIGKGLCYFEFCLIHYVVFLYFRLNNGCDVSHNVKIKLVTRFLWILQHSTVTYNLKWDMN
jgi:hypothetical protein